MFSWTYNDSNFVRRNSGFQGKGAISQTSAQKLEHALAPPRPLLCQPHVVLYLVLEFQRRSSGDGAGMCLMKVSLLRHIVAALDSSSGFASQLFCCVHNTALTKPVLGIVHCLSSAFFFHPPTTTLFFGAFIIIITLHGHAQRYPSFGPDGSRQAPYPD